VLIALFLTTLATVPSAISADSKTTWNVQTVAENASPFAGNCPIAVDSNNITHIAYSAWTGKEFFVMYASWNGSGFSTQAVAPGVYVIDFVLDAYNNPHIIYFNYDAPGRPIMYASWTGTNWDIQNTGINNAHYAALALDSSDNPHLAYTDSQFMKYASWTGFYWNIQTVDTYARISNKLFLALDSNNTPWILYAYVISVTIVKDMGYSYNNVRLAKLENSSWNIQNFTLNLNDFGNMVLDSKAFLHFTCQELFPNLSGLVNSTLFYVSWNGSIWKTDPVVSGIYLNSIGSLALDSNNTPHICYIIPAPNGLIRTQYASWTGTNWDIQTADSNISGSQPSLAFDSSGNPHISYLARGLSDYANLLYVTTIPETKQTPSPFPTLIVAVAAVIAMVVVGGLLVCSKEHQAKKV